MIIFRVLRKFKKILNANQKEGIIKLAFLMIIGGFLEMMSVSLMIPFINAVINPEEVMGKDYVRFIFDTFGIKSYNSFLILSSLVLGMAYIIKNVYLVLQTGIQNRFVTNNMFSFRVKLLRSYLDRPYEFFLEANSGEILRIITDDTAQIFNLLTSLLSFFSEMIVSVVLVVTIFIISPVMTVGMAVILFLMVFIIVVIIRPILTKAGKNYQISVSKMNQWLMQSIHGIKDIKIMCREEFFIDNFEKNGMTAAKSRYQNITLAAIPRFLIEAVSLGAFFLMVAIMIYRGFGFGSLIPILSAVAMAAIRLLPATNRISQSMAEIAYSEPMLDKALENIEGAINYTKLEKTKHKEKKIGKFSQIIEMKNITYKYPSGDNYILEDANLEIKNGQSIGIVGKSGSGKTTTVDLLLGLLQPEKGAIIVDGLDVFEDIGGWIANISYIPQTIFMLDGSIRENVAFGVKNELIDDDKVKQSLEEASLKEFIQDLPRGIETQIGERGIRLSGGQRQRIGIARALYSDPSVLIFDEATSALDNDTENAIMESINHLQGKKTMIIIAHRLTTIEKCNCVYRVENKKIIKEKGNAE